ncbi:hypothetical protein CR513_26356, partial [Mucuna pruriens]
MCRQHYHLHNLNREIQDVMELQHYDTLGELVHQAIKEYLCEKGELLVDKQVEVVFTLGTYEDKVTCDVVPMEATHLLLGRSWKFDKRVIHDRVTNRFTFVHLGQRVVLKCLSPREVNEDQNKMRVKIELERKTTSKVEKK